MFSEPFMMETLDREITKERTAKDQEKRFRLCNEFSEQLSGI